MIDIQNNSPDIDYTKVIHIEGIGSISANGELDMEKVIKRLLKSKYING